MSQTRARGRCWHGVGPSPGLSDPPTCRRRVLTEWKTRKTPDRPDVPRKQVACVAGFPCAGGPVLWTLELAGRVSRAGGTTWSEAASAGHVGVL